MHIKAQAGRLLLRAEICVRFFFTASEAEDMHPAGMLRGLGQSTRDGWRFSFCGAKIASPHIHEEAPHGVDHKHSMQYGIRQPQRLLTGASRQFPWCWDMSKRAFFIWGNRIAPVGGSRRSKIAG